MTFLENLFSSGYIFDENESLLRFRFRMLNSMMVVISLFSLLFALMNSLRINNIGTIHGTVDYLYSVSMIVLIFWLRQSKEHYQSTAVSVLTISLLVFTSALLFVPQDEFRIIWFYLLIFAAYIVSGSRLGFIFLALSLADIIFCYTFFDLFLSDTAIKSALFGLIIGGLFSHFYTQKINDYNELLHAKNQELEHYASKDFLTGMMNRRVFLQMGKKYFLISSRHQKPLSFLMIDIDHFKAINDTFGHEMGDNVLKNFSLTLKDNLRENDLAGRLGGEEFGIILPETNLEQAMVVAEKIRLSIATMKCYMGNKPFIITVSIGVSELIPSDVSLEQIQKRADKALYFAKNEGRNQTVSSNAVQSKGSNSLG